LVAVVSASMAQRYWPGLDPIGRHISIDGVRQIAIVGIVGDVHHASLAANPRPTFYVPYRQDPWPAMTFALRTAAAPATITASVREAVWRVDKDQPVGAILTMDQRLSNSLSGQRFNATLLVVFGIVAVALAAIGLYGVLTFIVAQRRREIGVRMALGATARDVINDVMGQGLRLAALGVVVGRALSAVATRLLRTLLFGTSPTDVATFASVAAVLLLIAAVASAVPALRASRVDPLIALRDD